jgi:hypothetical protein
MLDSNSDMTFGKSMANIYIDSPDGVAQCVLTRLRFWLGEWFLDTTDGTNWAYDVLGKYTAGTRDPMIQARVLGTQGVSDIAAYASQLDRETRAWSVQVTINTAYGQTVISGPI